MSEEKKETKPNEEPKTDKVDDKYAVVGDNVALLKSRILILEGDVAEKDALIEELTSKLGQATEFIEADQKKMLLAEVSPRVDIPDEHLMLKTLDELKDMKKVLDVARVPAFKAGTPFNLDKKPTQRAKLASVHDEYMAKIGGKK